MDQQSIVRTVIAKASVETRSIDALSDSTDLYRAAKRTTMVARGKQQHTSASRAKGLLIIKRWSKANKTADCKLTDSLAKHSFVDLCSLIERAPLSLIGPGAIIRGVFRRAHAEDSSLPF